MGEQAQEVWVDLAKILKKSVERQFLIAMAAPCHGVRCSEAPIGHDGGMEAADHIVTASRLHHHSPSSSDVQRLFCRTS